MSVTMPVPMSVTIPEAMPVPMPVPMSVTIPETIPVTMPETIPETMKRIPTVIFLVGSMLGSAIAHGQRSLGAHTHGRGHITIVFEKKQLIIEMTAPAGNMLGFEHRPHSDREWQMIDILKQRLQHPKNLVELKPECELQNAVVDLPFNKLEPQDHHHRGQNDDTHQPDHHDIRSRYEWLCDGTNFPKLNFKYFIEYPAFETIDVEWIINGKQGLNQLNKRESRLDIAQ